MSEPACSYHERNHVCREIPVYEARLDGRDLWLCERHVRPEFWPPDLRKKLPGRLKRLVASVIHTQQRGGRA